MSSSEPEDPLIGVLLADRYRVEKKLGEGGMGVVYQGLHEAIGRPVALKVLRPKLAKNKTAVARFHREAKAATAIRNQHIIEVTDVGTLPSGGFFMVLEYLEGMDLSELLRREGPLDVGRTAHIVLQVCDALAAAHTAGIVHRDLKAENIYLIERGGDPSFVKVLDFGISKFVRLSETRGPAMSALTRTGAIMGTPYYLSPEQAMGEKEVDRRTDIYAVGVLLYRCLTGHYPFEANTIAALVGA